MNRQMNRQLQKHRQAVDQINFQRVMDSVPDQEKYMTDEELTTMAEKYLLSFFHKALLHNLPSKETLTPEKVLPIIIPEKNDKEIEDAYIALYAGSDAIASHSIQTTVRSMIKQTSSKDYNDHASVPYNCGEKGIFSQLLQTTLVSDSIIDADCMLTLYHIFLWLHKDRSQALQGLFNALKHKHRTRLVNISKEVQNYLESCYIPMNRDTGFSRQFAENAREKIKTFIIKLQAQIETITLDTLFDPENYLAAVCFMKVIPFVCFFSLPHRHNVTDGEKSVLPLFLDGVCVKVLSSSLNPFKSLPGIDNDKIENSTIRSLYKKSLSEADILLRINPHLAESTQLPEYSLYFQVIKRHTSFEALNTTVSSVASSIATYLMYNRVVLYNSFEAFVAILGRLIYFKQVTEQMDKKLQDLSIKNKDLQARQEEVANLQSEIDCLKAKNVTLSGILSEKIEQNQHLMEEISLISCVENEADLQVFKEEVEKEMETEDPIATLSTYRLGVCGGHETTLRILMDTFPGIKVIDAKAPDLAKNCDIVIGLDFSGHKDTMPVKNYCKAHNIYFHFTNAHNVKVIASEVVTFYSLRE